MVGMMQRNESDVCIGGLAFKEDRARVNTFFSLVEKKKKMNEFTWTFQAFF